MEQWYPIWVSFESLVIVVVTSVSLLVASEIFHFWAGSKSGSRSCCRSVEVRDSRVNRSGVTEIYVSGSDDLLQPTKYGRINDRTKATKSFLFGLMSVIEFTLSWCYQPDICRLEILANNRKTRR